MRSSVIILSMFAAWVPLFAQVKYSMTTDRSTYQYGDSIDITIKSVNEGDTPDTLYMTLCDVNYFVDGYNLDAHRPCPLVIVPYIIPPHDSLTWGSDYLPPFPVTDTLAAGKHSIVGELNGYWISDTVWVNVLSNAAAAADILFPLDKGDFWQYRAMIKNENDTAYSVEYGTRMVLGDTTCSNGRTYAVVSDSNLGPGGYGAVQEGLIRIDSATGCVYQFSGGGEEIIDSLEMEKGDQLITYPRPPYPLTCISVDTELVFGQMRTVKKFSVDYTVLDPSEFEYDYAAGVGMIEMSSLGGPSGSASATDSLVFARINGIEYGNLVNVQTTPVSPSTFELSQNYPNPFNPTTDIEYRIAGAGFVSLKIFDVLGREVETLVNMAEQPGSYTVTFDGSNLPSGVYFYRLKVGRFMAVKKLMLIK